MFSNVVSGGEHHAFIHLAVLNAGAVRNPSTIWELQGFLGAPGNAYLWLARSEGMDPSGSPYKTRYSSFHVLFHSFIPS